MKRHDQKGRSTTERYMQLHEWFMRSDAWRAATVYERCLYLEIKRRYNGRNNGEIALSHREAADLLGCSNKPVMKAFSGLLDKGFIRISQKGSFDWKASEAGGRSTRWILTEFPVDAPLRSLQPTKEFMKWKPPAQQEKRHAESTPMVGPEHTIPEGLACPEHTIDIGVYAHGTR